MFLEQLPAIICTLELLKAWILQQQQQQQQSHWRNQVPNHSSSSSGAWLKVPRFLGKHTLTLFDLGTGAALEPASGKPLQRLASSYVAWRVAEIVGWYQKLSQTDQSSVQQLLQDVSAAGFGGSSSSAERQAGTAGTGSAGVAAAAQMSSVSQHNVGQQQQQQQQVLTVARDHVDAVQAFAQVVQLVRECGRIERRGNKVVVWPAAPGAPSSKL
jgi:hypothetical protein